MTEPSRHPKGSTEGPAAIDGRYAWQHATIMRGEAFTPAAKLHNRVERNRDTPSPVPPRGSV